MPSGTCSVLNVSLEKIRITPETFEKAYNENWKNLYSLCYYYVNHQEEAEEIIQDLFKSIWERRADLIIHTSVEQYLFRALKLKIAEHFRTKAVHRKHWEELKMIAVHAEASTEQAVFYNDLQNNVNELVGQMSPQSRNVYTMSREEGLTVPEIASRLSITAKTAENHLTRALGFLKKRLLQK